jgi:hypothetical protein
MAERRDIPGSVNDVYSVVGALFETPHSRVVKAQESTTGSLCGLVLPKVGGFSSETLLDSLNWLARASEEAPGLFKIASYGVDSSGMLYAALPPIDSEPYCKGGLSVQEAERRLISLLRTIKKLHEVNLVVGDLSAACLRLDRSGALQITGDGQNIAQYLQPSVDVHALGSIAAVLFTGTPPDGQAVGLKLKEAPVWIDTLISKCLQSDPRMRYQNAGEMLMEIDDLRKKSAESEFVPASVSSEVVASDKKNQTRVAFHGGLGSTANGEQEPEVQKQPAKSKVLPFLLSGGVGAALVVGWFAYDLLLVEPETALKLRDGTEIVVREGANEAERAFLSQLASDPNAVTYPALVEQLSGVPSSEMRVAIESEIVRKVKELGYPLVGVQLEQYFAKVRAKVAPDGYVALLKSAEPGIELEMQSASLREAYAVDPETSLRLAAALALESKKLASYTPLLKQLVGDRLQLKDTEGYSSVGLLLLPEDLALLFSDAIFAESVLITDEELPRLLSTLAERKDLSLRTLVTLALDRSLVGAIPSVFLEVIRDRRDLTPEILSSLVKGAVGSLEPGNLDSLGQWFDPDAPRVLMAALATATNPTVAEEAMDLLAGKGVTEEPAATFLQYVRKRYWEKRGALGYVVGVFAFLDRASEDVIKGAVERLAQFAGDKDLIRQVLMTNNVVVVPRIIKRFPEFIELGTKLELLSNPSKEIRLAAVESIETNDVGALKIINDAFKSEQDPEVKQAYKRFWTISNRMK